MLSYNFNNFSTNVLCIIIDDDNSVKKIHKKDMNPFMRERVFTKRRRSLDLP